MIDNYSLYYLNQMGIYPWLKKEDKKVVLAIYTNETKNEKITAFIQAIAHYLAINSNDIKYLSPGEAIEKFAAEALFAFAVDNQLLKEGKTVFFNQSLEKVMGNSQLKRQLYVDLQAVKNSLAS